MNPSYRWWLAGCLLLLGCWPPWLMAADDKPVTVTVQGEALITEGNTPQARQRALQEAFSTALTQVMGSYISAESYTRNFESIERGVYGKTQGYIKHYQIQQESVDRNVLTLTVQVTVSTQAVLDELTALGIVLSGMGNPVLRVEGTDEGLSEPQSVEVFQQKLGEKGFQVLNKDDAGQAEVIVRLAGSVRSASRVAGMQGAITALNASAYWRKDNRLIASTATVSNGAGMTEADALKTAYGAAADTLFPEFLERLLAKWQDEINNGRPIQLTVIGGTYRQAQMFQQRLARLFGVRSAVLKSFSGNEASILVSFAGTADLLGQLIAKTDFREISVDILELGPGQVKLAVARGKS